VIPWPAADVSTNFGGTWYDAHTERHAIYRGDVGQEAGETTTKRHVIAQGTSWGTFWRVWREL